MQRTLQILIQKRLQAPEKTGSLHISCVIDRHFNPMQIASNIYRQSTNSFSIHAEENLMKKIGNGSPRKLKYVDILVIRVTRNGDLVASKPCCRCLQSMIKSYNNGVKVRSVFYSDDTGSIIKKDIRTLLKEPIYLTKLCKSRNYNPSIFG